VRSGSGSSTQTQTPSLFAASGSKGRAMVVGMAALAAKEEVGWWLLLRNG